MIVVTGGAGFIGSAIIYELNRQGENNILVVDDLGDDFKWKNLIGLSFVNVMGVQEFLAALENNGLEELPSAIIHMGACSSTTERDADYLIKNNLHYTQALCNYAANEGIRFIHASSAATYGDGSNGFSDNPEDIFKLRPLNMYGYSKQLFDLWAMRKGLACKMVALKFFNVYGPNEYHKGSMRSMVAKAFEEIGETGSIKLFKSNSPEYEDGGQLRDFIYVKDCAKVVCWLLKNSHITGIYNLGTGEARSWNDLARAVFGAMNMPVNIKYVNMPDSLKGQYQNFTEAEMSNFKRAGLESSFYSLEEGVSDYVCNYLAMGYKHLG